MIAARSAGSLTPALASDRSNTFFPPTGERLRDRQFVDRRLVLVRILLGPEAGKGVGQGGYPLGVRELPLGLQLRGPRE
jgi:hypothetical protein